MRILKISKFKWSKVKKPIFVLAPMADITTSAYRLICKKMGADLVYIPMISSNAILHDSKKTWELAKFQESEQPVILQIFGYDGNILAKAANLVDKKFKPAGIDLNLGCPAPKIVGNECGSALLKNLEKTLEIVQTVRKNFPGQLSVKLRLGWKEYDILDFCKKLESIGIDAIAIHGRTTKAKFSGQADWQPIYEIAGAVKIPVLGNGDITTWQNAYTKLKNGNLAGVMIGRGALGNPWIFQATKEKRDIKVNKTDLKRIILQHTKLHIQDIGEEKRAILEMRKHFSWYIKGFPGASDIRKQLMKIESLKELIKILSKMD